MSDVEEIDWWEITAKLMHRRIMHTVRLPESGRRAARLDPRSKPPWMLYCSCGWKSQGPFYGRESDARRPFEDHLAGEVRRLRSKYEAGRRDRQEENPQ